MTTQEVKGTYEAKATLRMMENGKLELVLKIDSLDVEEMVLEEGDMPKSILSKITVEVESQELPQFGTGFDDVPAGVEKETYNKIEDPEYHVIQKLWINGEWVCKHCMNKVTYHVQEMRWVHVNEVK